LLNFMGQEVERHMSNGRSNVTYVGIGLLGAAVGIVAGLLVAPAPGRETRRRLSRRIGEEREALLRKGQLAVEGVTDYLQETGRRVTSVVNG
jgi:gas vesicle protein